MGGEIKFFKFFLSDFPSSSCWIVTYQSLLTTEINLQPGKDHKASLLL